ncbi:phage baseplate protein [Listeria seeligeri]|uniref:phage baseplate protein n=1 Tax=Listeria seeligeri TaxID=1640 RepID=UPI0016270D89|nr:teichoic acid biosynthesis protein [Listeria seeligeri]MBC1430941.1 teichoic acid biosynthesis protein [Listeria seeligeri]
MANLKLVENEATILASIPKHNVDYNARVMQSVSVDYERNMIYWTQQYSGKKMTDANAGESYNITRTDLKGKYIDQMWCLNGGHGTNIALDYDSATKKMYIWSAYKVNNKWEVVRYPYESNKILKGTEASIFISKVESGSYNRISGDLKNDMLVFHSGGDPKTFNIRIVRASAIKEGKLEVLYKVKASEANDTYTYQGCALDFPYLYTSSGGSEEPKQVTCVDVVTGRRVYQTTFKFNTKAMQPTETNYAEPENVCVYYKNNKKHIVVGYALGGAGNRMNRAFDLVEMNSEDIETEIESLRNLILNRKRTELIFNQSTKGDLTTTFKLRETLKNFDIIQVVLESGGGYTTASKLVSPSLFESSKSFIFASSNIGDTSGTNVDMYEYAANFNDDLTTFKNDRAVKIEVSNNGTTRSNITNMGIKKIYGIVL